MQANLNLFWLFVIIAFSVWPNREACAAPAQVTVVSEYKITKEELSALSKQFGVAIKAGYYNTYEFEGFQYGLNYLMCGRGGVDDLAGIAIQLEPRATLVRAPEGVYEVLTFEPELARKIILALPGVEQVEQAKLIPVQFPPEWQLAGESYAKEEQVEQLKNTLGKGIVKVLNQVFIPGSENRASVNYYLCDNADHAQFIYASLAGGSKMPGSVLRYGRLVIAITTDDDRVLKEIKANLGS